MNSFIDRLMMLMTLLTGILICAAIAILLFVLCFKVLPWVVSIELDPAKRPSIRRDFDGNWKP